MRRFASLGVAAVTALALATPVAAVSASAAPGSPSAVTVAEKAKPKKKPRKIKIKKSEDGVQPGISKLVLTAKGLKGKGKVKFTITGDNGASVKEKAKVRKGKAELLVPPLGTGQYKVKAKFKKQKGKTKFEVYDSQLSVATTSFVLDRSELAKPATPDPAITGNVRFKGAPAAVGGYVDMYQNGNIAGGLSSPDYIDDAPITEGGNFSNTLWSSVLLNGSGTRRAPLPNGTYTFQVFYTNDAGFEDYLSSNVITVVIQD